MTARRLLGALTAVALLGGVIAGPGGSAAGAARTVKVTLKEWKLTPSTGTVSAGRVTFVVRNAGKVPHEFVVLRTSRHHHALPVRGAKADETGALGEIERVAPGKTRRLTLTLRRAKLVLICNLPGHYRAGQYASLRVR